MCVNDWGCVSALLLDIIFFVLENRNRRNFYYPGAGGWTETKRSKSLIFWYKLGLTSTILSDTLNLSFFNFNTQNVWRCEVCAIFFILLVLFVCLLRMVCIESILAEKILASANDGQYPLNWNGFYSFFIV